MNKVIKNDNSIIKFPEFEFKCEYCNYYFVERLKLFGNRCIKCNNIATLIKLKNK